MRRLRLRELSLNSVLQAIEGPLADVVLERGEYASLKVRERIYTPEEPIETVFFPTNSVLSIVSHMRDGDNIEIGTIGREGMSAFPLLLGASSTANDCYCQVPGDVISMPVDLFRLIVKESRRFREVLDRYLQGYVNMLGQLAACNRLHSVYERCARWLLLTHDRVESDEIPLTHEYLAMMLGTGRSGVTIAAGTLQQAGFIRYGHGVIRIVDRRGLEDAACECYETAREQFGGLLRPVEA